MPSIMSTTTQTETTKGLCNGQLLLATDPDYRGPGYTPYIIKPPKPVCVTLSGPLLLVSAFSLSLVIHLRPIVAECIIALIPLFLAIRTDYQNFLNLGPGGTPSTPAGYLRITWLKLWTLRDPLTAPSTPLDILPSSGLFTLDSSDGSPSYSALPYRLGPRPSVVGIAPQRQVDQHGSMEEYRALRKSMIRLSAQLPERFGAARSCFEKQGLALFARRVVNKTCHGEVCHVHDTDHSMHLNLHPDDMREVLEKGWGQRHPLACRGWFGPNIVPETFVMIYGPRNEEELRVVYQIIEAAIWFVTAERADIAGPRPTAT